MKSKRVYAAWFGIHFLLITAVCFAGLFWLIAERATILPPAFNQYARKAELIAAWLLGRQAGASSPVRRGIATYLHAAGIQAGYTFFAPNKAAALRLNSLLDKLADARYEPLREVVVKMLALSVWRQRPDVTKIRATFGSVNPPSITDFEHGKRESFQPMFSYDFSLRE